MLVKSDNQEYEISNGVKETTNNRMEIQAAIEAVKWWKNNKSDKEAIIHTDSKYVKDGITKWMSAWVMKDFKDIKNDDLWRTLNEINSPMIEWKWVKAHTGNEENERVDKMAREQALKQKETLCI